MIATRVHQLYGNAKRRAVIYSVFYVDLIKVPINIDH